MSIELCRLDATSSNAERFQTVLYEDYLRIGMPDKDAEAMAYGSEDPLGDRLTKMKSADLRHYGAIIDSKLAVVACLGSWRYGDEIPYMPDVINRKARRRHRLLHVLGRDSARYDGLLAFGISSEADQYRDAVAHDAVHSLMSVVRQNSRRRGLRAEIDSEDTGLIESFEHMGGRPVGDHPGMRTIRGVDREYVMYGIDA